MPSFTLTPVEKGILRCQHISSFSTEDIQSLTGLLRDYRGKLPVDLTGADVEECSRYIRHLRPMMPISAVLGASIDPAILDIDPSYYVHDMQLVESEAAALEWLHNQ